MLSEPAALAPGVGRVHRALTLPALMKSANASRSEYERLVRLRSARAFGQQDVQPVFHLGLTGVEGQDALVKDYRPFGPVQIFIDQSKLGERGHVMRIELEGLLKAGLGARQIAELMPKPTIQSISGCQS